MPYICSPDSMYVMECSSELLEITPDVHFASYLSGFNLDYYFDNYDAYYMREGASPAISNLSSLMYNWIDQQDPVTKSIALSANIYDVHMQLNELVSGVSNKLIENYLKNIGITEDKSNDIGIYLNLDMNQDTDLNIFSESDIIVPANIGTALIEDNRMYNYITNLKSQLKKSFELNVSLDSARKKYTQISNEQIKNRNTLNDPSLQYLLTDQQKNKKIEFGKKALKKGIKKFTNLFGDSKIKSFISGSGFTVEGKLYNWNFSQRGNVSIISMTHTPLNGHIPYILTLMTKDNLELANCCVYVSENTPIIDQIITIMLYIQHDEEELLQNCNLFNFRKENFSKLPKNFNNHFSAFSVEENNKEKHIIQTSHYHDLFNQLKQKYNLEVKKQFSKVIGIEENFLNYLMTNKVNPIIEGSSSEFYLDIFKENKQIIKI
jgi:hypothetical protein